MLFAAQPQEQHQQRGCRAPFTIACACPVATRAELLGSVGVCLVAVTACSDTGRFMRLLRRILRAEWRV